MSGELGTTGKILIYQNEKGDTKIDVYFEEDTIWMTQKAMCELYQVAKSSVSEHISNIFKDGELEPEATVRKFRTVQTEGTRQVTRERDYYNLDMILAVGYRVRSNVGIHFRRWASSVLTEYMKKGFALNDERLRNPREFGADYFDELLERIRDIRASEKRVYQKVKGRYSPSRWTTTAKARSLRTSSNRFRTSWNMLPRATLRRSSLPSGPMLPRITWDSLLLKGVKVRRGRCDSSEKLYDPRWNQYAESDCEYVSGLCGAAGQRTHPYAHGRLGKQARRFSAFQWSGSFREFRNCEAGGCGKTGAGAI